MKPAVLIQSLKQMWGIIAIEHKYQGRLPNKDNYSCTVKYSLPFHETWTAGLPWTEKLFALPAISAKTIYLSGMVRTSTHFWHI